MKKIMLTLLTLVLSFNVYSQTLIDKQPLKIVVPLGPGGGIDTIARIIGKNLSEVMKVPVVVENKPGGNSVPAGKFVANEEPNGKTLLFFVPHSYTLNNIYTEYANQIFEWDKELTPVSMIYWSPFILVVNKKTNVNSLSELKEKFKNKDISFASTGTGTALHIYSEIIFNKLEMKSIHIPYKSLPPAINDVLGENVDAIATGQLMLVPQIKAGNLTPLLILSDKVNPEFPNVPTMTGMFSEYSNLKIVGSFLVNKNTDPAIREKLKKDIELATKNSMEELKQKNFVDASESIVYDDRKMKQIEKNWITAVEKIKSTQQLPKKH